MDMMTAALMAGLILTVAAIGAFFVWDSK